MEQKSYFTFKELTRTDTGIPNYPSTWTQVINLIQLESILSAIRKKFGHPIYVNSAFRTTEVNDAVKGSKFSYHLQGRAADIRPDYYPSQDYKQNLQNLVDVIKDGFKSSLKEFIVYPTFIHIAF